MGSRGEQILARIGIRLRSVGGSLDQWESEPLSSTPPDQQNDVLILNEEMLSNIPVIFEESDTHAIPATDDIPSTEFVYEGDYDAESIIVDPSSIPVMQLDANTTNDDQPMELQPLESMNPQLGDSFETASLLPTGSSRSAVGSSAMHEPGQANSPSTSASSDSNYSPSSDESSSAESEALSPNTEQHEQEQDVQQLLLGEPHQAQGESEQRDRTRKRRLNPSEWKRNKSKRLRNSGKQYVSIKHGRLVEERKMQPSCGESCRLRCSGKFSEEERQSYFDRFWELGSIELQRNFISKSMQTVHPKYRYLREGGRPRSQNNAYYFKKDELNCRVCKVFFLNTLNISDKFIRTVVQKSKDGFLQKDNRGLHLKTEVGDVIKNDIRRHISSIPAIESHYTRANSTKKYIDGGKTVAQLYRDYKTECELAERPFGNISMYRYIFNFEFNLSFFSPKKDLCAFCTTYENSDEDGKKKMQSQYDLHHKEKNLSRNEKEKDKNSIDKLHVVACFDLQATLPLPRGNVSSFYYKSRLSTYNFTVCELEQKGLGQVHCYCWHEGEGKRGSIEIASNLHMYLKEKAASSNDDQLEIKLYSDNCGGQQKNKFVVSMYLYAVANLKIKSITHKFFIVGHGQNEGDSTHSLIEKNVSRALKSFPLYIPSEYAMLIRTAKRKGQPFQVHQLNHTHFSDFKEMTDVITNNFTQNDNGEKFNFNDICCIKVEKSEPTKYYYKTSYTQSDYQTVTVKINKTRRTSSSKQFFEYELKDAYPGQLPISKNKYKDLKSLVESGSIPSSYSQFYNTLKTEYAGVIIISFIFCNSGLEFKSIPFKLPVGTYCGRKIYN